jgi:hypothetical protein
MANADIVNLCNTGGEYVFRNGVMSAWKKKRTSNSNVTENE